jgi:uncharacterized protein YndB with AHSA1/START domain
MKSNHFVAKAQIMIDAPVDKVWDAFVNPEVIKKYMFGAKVESDWKEGSAIVWRGTWNGTPFEDKGVILEIKPKTKLSYSHFSPLAGLPDKPENYHTVTIELTDRSWNTAVSLSQDNNATEKAREHAEKNWGTMLSGLKKMLEVHKNWPATC